MNGKKIAFFDFDGTITTRDSLLEIIKFLKGGTAYYTGMLLNMHWFMANQIHLISASLLKEKILSYFFSGTPENVFKEQCDQFAECDLPGFIRKGAIAEMDRLRREGFEMVIVSASAENWIRGFANRQSLGLIATKLEVKNGLITGKLEGKNCSGGQKVIRIKERWDLKVYEEIYVYGDSPADKPMMALATRSFYQPFRKA
ncbi:MAG TPA: HAD family hydrolase [Puia sp.]|nr:HAD family hydrolase [Puia sp.]